MKTVELPIECHAEDAQQMKSLGVEAPDPVVMPTMVVLDKIVGWNATEGDSETVLYLTNGDALGVHVSYQEVTRRIREAAFQETQPA